MNFKQWTSGELGDADEDEVKYKGKEHDFEQLKQSIAWKDIVVQLKDRLELIRNELEDPEESPDMTSVAILRQEAHDIRWFMSLPDMTISALKRKESEDEAVSDVQTR